MNFYTTLLALILAAGFSSAFVETAVANQQSESEEEQEEDKVHEDELEQA